MNPFNNKLQNYSSQPNLPKRYQSPNSGVNHNNNNSPSCISSNKVETHKQSQVGQQQYPYQQGQSSTAVQQTSQYNQNQTSSNNQALGQSQMFSQNNNQWQAVYQTSQNSQGLVQNNQIKSTTLNTNSTYSQGKIGSSSQKNAQNQMQPQLSNSIQSSVNQVPSSYSNIQSRLKQTKHKSQNAFSTTSGNYALSTLPFGSSQEHTSSLSPSSQGVSSSFVSNKIQEKHKQIMAQSHQFPSSTNMMRENDYQKNVSGNINSVRVKTDYSVEKKGAPDLFVSSSSPTYLSASKTINTYGNQIQNLQNSTMFSSTSHAQNLIQKNQIIENHSSPQQLGKSNSTQQQFQQQSQFSQQRAQTINNNKMLLKKHKSQQINDMLKTDPNVGDYQTNLTVFVHYKGKRIGPISLNAIERNIEWLTKQIINEIVMYEQIQMPTNCEKENDSLEIDNIIHFQSYQHRNISLSYYLTLPERPLDPLLNKSLILEPFYGENPDSDEQSLKNQSQYQVSLKDFHFIKCVGMGGFSRVYLVQKKDNGKMYALKLIEKKFIQTNKKEVIVQNERNIMTIMQGHPFLLQLDYAFESKNYIAFAMEYCAGGEMQFHFKNIN